MLGTFDKRAVSSSLNRRMEVKNGKHNKKLQLNIPCIGGSPGVFHHFLPVYKILHLSFWNASYSCKYRAAHAGDMEREKRWTSRK